MLAVLIIVRQTLDMTEVKVQFVPVYIKGICHNPAIAVTLKVISNVT
jgi:hypothetical protein